MLSSDHHRNNNQPVPLLVVDFHLDHQLLIEHTLQTAIPQAKPVFKSTALEALDYLVDSLDHRGLFPKLVVMDIYLPLPDAGWQLLQTLRLRYPTLPVIVLSGNTDAETILKAYELGALSFVEKPAELTQWEPIFSSFREYWLRTVTLPPPN